MCVTTSLDVCTMSIQAPEGPEEGIQTQEAGVTDRHESFSVCADS